MTPWNASRPVRPIQAALVLALLALTTRAAGAGDAPQVTSSGESVKGATREVGDLKVTPVKLRANVLGCMFWADKDGTGFWALDPVGACRLISFPDLKEVRKIELDRKCSWLAPSAEGLVASVVETQEVWLVDPAKGAVKHKIKVADLKRAVSALGLSTAFAVNDQEMLELDLKAGKAARYAGEAPKFGNYADPVMSPDGKYLFTRGLETMNRFGVKSGKARLQQEGPRIAQGRVDIGIQVSVDAKFVALPSYAGNYGTNYGVNVYPVENIERPEAVLQFGGPCGMAFAADPRGGKFYAEGLLVFGQDGKRERAEKLDAGEVKQILVHPAGGRLLILGTGQFLLVEMPRK
jgi:hypothetical protein